MLTLIACGPPSSSGERLWAGVGGWGVVLQLWTEGRLQGASVSQPPRFNCPGWPRTRNSLTLTPVFLELANIQVLTNWTSLARRQTGPLRYKGTQDWSAGGAAHPSKAAPGLQVLGAGLSSSPGTNSAGITRKGLPDFKGNSQNLESAEDQGRVLSGLQWIPRRQGRGLAGRAAWSVWPGLLQSEGHLSQLSRIRDGGPPGPDRRHLPLT